MSTYKAINLVKLPVGTIGPELFEVVENTVPEPAEGEFLVSQAYMSLDPAPTGCVSSRIS